MSKKIKFGTDGWRGIIGKDFTLENVEICAQAIADYLLLNTKYKILNTKVAVGYDTRRFSRKAARLISGVLNGNKIKVTLSDRPLPTQALSYAVRRQAALAGIMVTASHNPPYFNGIKIKGPFGGSVESKITNRIERLIFKHRPLKLSIEEARSRGLLRITNFIPEYLKLVRSYLDMPLLKKGHLRVLVDSMHGTADSYIAEILKDTACKVTTIHKSRDCSFGGIKPEPIQSCLKEASSLMKRGHFDVALATDGDADRIAALDSKGRFINPQEIMPLLLLHLIRGRKLKGAIAKTISGTALLEGIAKRYKLKVYETPIGFKHICRLMQKRNILIGGEEAGGIGFKNYLPERDGILAGLLLLEMMLATGRSLEVLWEDAQEEFGRFVYLRKDLNCASGEKDKVRKNLQFCAGERHFSAQRLVKLKITTA